jgi:hypothetical protein
MPKVSIIGGLCGTLFFKRSYVFLCSRSVIGSLVDCAVLDLGQSLALENAIGNYEVAWGSSPGIRVTSSV